MLDRARRLDLDNSRISAEAKADSRAHIPSDLGEMLASQAWIFCAPAQGSRQHERPRLGVFAAGLAMFVPAGDG
jgi:hypothetical protein